MPQPEVHWRLTIAMLALAFASSAARAAETFDPMS